MADLRRAATISAVVTALLGGALMAYGVSALPRPWTTGYISQAGAPGATHAGAYRAGVLLLALTLFLLGNALMSLAGVLLIGAGALAAVSSRISCTPGCPLPPYEHSTGRDLVHAGTSIAAIGVTVLAMLAIAAFSPDHRQRRVARIAAVICGPVLVALAITLLAIGRSTTTAVLERIGLTGVLFWVIGCALLALRRPGLPAVHRSAPPTAAP
jgi:arginine exporter protein ArgO